MSSPVAFAVMSADGIRNICVVTSNRSDWGKLRPVAAKLRLSKDVNVSILAVGSHLLREFGHTVDEIKLEFPDVQEVATSVAGDTAATMVDSVGLGIIKISGALQQLAPAICLIHGDRFEAFSAAVAANLLNVAVAHIEGGELSGTVDGYLRHAVTKLSHLHFACSEDAVHRIKAMGENSSYVFLTGCPSYERLFSVYEQENSWQYHNVEQAFPHLERGNYIIAMMHPCVTEEAQSIADYESLVAALFTLKRKTVFIYPNLDPGNKRMIQILHKYQKMHQEWPRWLMIHTHLSPNIFATLMRDASVMVGNSSAGIRETCVFGTPTLNLGKRQLGRLQPANVTTIIRPDMTEVMEWIIENYERRFNSSTEFGSRISPDMISKVLTTVNVKTCKEKTFSDFQYLVPCLPIEPKCTVLEKTFVTSETSETPRVLGVITARGGSKGIPGKNLAPLGNKPLLCYTIEAALSSKLLDRCVLSTDCAEIARVGKLAGCEVPFMRPEELARDDSAHMDCLIHAVSTLSQNEHYEADYVMILQPTSPFRTGEDIDKAISIAMERGCDAVVSVTESRIPLTKIFRTDNNSTQAQPFVHSMPGVKYVRRQDSPRVYAENGAIFLQRTASILKPSLQRTGSLFTSDLQLYIMPQERSIDVDEPHDLELARALVTYRASRTSSDN